MFLNINQLRSFYTAAKLNSVTMAAKELMVTPPAISKQIKQLENYLEMKLIFRQGNSIQLTKIGRMVLKESDKIFTLINKMENHLEDISSGKTGVLKIGSPQTPAKYIMPRLVAKFKKMYPGIRIVLDQGTSSEMIKSLINQRNELAVVRHSPNEKKLKIKTFGSEEIVLISSPRSQHLPDRQISATQLSSVPMILQQEGSATRDVLFEYFQRFNVNPRIVLESKSIELIKQLVRQNDGVGFLVRSAVKKELEDKILKSFRILEGSLSIEYGISYLNRKTLSPAAWAFLRLLDKFNGVLPAI